MILVTIIMHWKQKNQNNNDAISFDNANNSIVNVDEDDNYNDDITNEYLHIIK